MYGKLILSLLFANSVFCCTIVQLEDYQHYNNNERIKRDLTTNCDPDDEIPPNRVNTTKQLKDLRLLMVQHGIDAYYVPLDEVGRRSWISGFSGSNGDVIITKDRALAWTDGRYFLQASQQLDCNWELMRSGEPEIPTETEFLSSELSEGSVVACDPTLFGAKTWIDMRNTLEKSGILFQSLKENLIDILWTNDNGRPPMKHRLVTPYSIEYAGIEWPKKIQNLRETIEKNGASAIVLTEHDEIAWIFNLRGKGSSNNEGLMHSPLFDSFSLISLDEIFLWIHTDMADSELLVHLTPEDCQTNNTCTAVEDISDFYSKLESWAKSKNETILVTNPSTYLTGANFAVYESIPENQVKFVDSPVMISKNVKNDVESEGMISSHIRDAVAVCQFAAHLEEQIQTFGFENWTEISASELLLDYRTQQALNDGPSFTTIAAFGVNSAVIHYTPTEETDAKIDQSNLFLVDSGGQYFDGTTDITRTFHYGTPSAKQIEMYTRVLMGAIDLASVKIPKNTKDGAIDLVTRQYLFDQGLNFRHGTGHGIGAYLKVHEGPINIHMHTGRRSTLTGSFAPNMFFSDEPGYYEDGNFGIRLETILRVVSMNLTDTTYGEFVKFQPITLVPFEPKLIDPKLMTVRQLEWLNMYNQEILGKVIPKITVNDERTLAWIRARTRYFSPGLSFEVQKYKDEI